MRRRSPEIAEAVDALYQSIIKAGTWKASSIKVAEAAKVIENSQRDLNIAFVNELSVIFDRLGIDTIELLIAAYLSARDGKTVSLPLEYSATWTLPSSAAASMACAVPGNPSSKAIRFSFMSATRS